MRVVFSDESGVGNRQKEPITVVTAVVLNMDRQWGPVSAELYRIIGDALKSSKSLLERGRALKGKILYSAIRKGIGEADAILRATLKVAIDNDILVFYGVVDRVEFENYSRIIKDTEREKGMTPFDKAFEICFSYVDRFIRTAYPNEQILWIADRSDRDREASTKNHCSIIAC